MWLSGVFTGAVSAIAVGDMPQLFDVGWPQFAHSDGFYTVAEIQRRRLYQLKAICSKLLRSVA
jgi:hypothetical protein